MLVSLDNSESFIYKMLLRKSLGVWATEELEHGSRVKALRIQID